MATAPQDESITFLEAITSKPYPPTALIFDSGVGGLSIYQEIRRWLPSLNVIYAFDNAYFPYGEKTEELIVERVINMVWALQKKHQIDIVIIACNTASTVSLPFLRERYSMPIVGVVPAIKPAAQQTRNGVIGLLATRATIHRSYTNELITRFAATCQVERIGSTGLVDIAERKLHGETVDLAKIEEILMPWLSLPVVPDTVVLGCTHFPLLHDELSAVLPKGTVLIDSGEAIARRVVKLLNMNEWPDSINVQNWAYCTKMDSDTQLLVPVLKQQGFPHLKEITL